MFERTSRYASLPVKTLAAPGAGGAPREIRYVARRFLPPVDAGAAIVEHPVAEGDRLDQIAAKYLGDPAQFWRVADANAAMDPAVLTARAGRRIRVALPGT